MSAPSLDDFGAVLFQQDLAHLLGMSLRTVQRLRKHAREKLPPEMATLDCKPRWANVVVAIWLENSREQERARLATSRRPAPRRLAG